MTFISFFGGLMEKMLLLILLFCIFGVLPVLRTNFFALYILQLKEYRRDRIKDFLSTKE